MLRTNNKTSSNEVTIEADHVDVSGILGLGNVTTSEMLALTNVHKGDSVYNTTELAQYNYNGSSWVPITPGPEPGTYVDLISPQTIGGAKTFVDSVTISALGNQLTFGELSASVSINASTPSSSVTHTIPDVGANASFIMSEGAQVVNGSKDFTEGLVSTSVNNQVTLGSGNTVTLNAPSPSSSRVFTLSDPGADANIVVSEGAQVINGNKNFANRIKISAPDNQLVLGSDDAKLVTISTEPITASRTYTLPDSGTDADFMMTEGAQTKKGTLTMESGNFVLGNNIFYWSTNGLGNMQYDTSDMALRISTNMKLDTTSQPYFTLQGNKIYTNTYVSSPLSQDFIQYRSGSHNGTTISGLTLNANADIMFSIGATGAGATSTNIARINGTGISIKKTGNTPRESIDSGGAIIIGDSTSNNAGTIRYSSAGIFEGSNGTTWYPLDALAFTKSTGTPNNGTSSAITTGNFTQYRMIKLDYAANTFSASYGPWSASTSWFLGTGPGSAVNNLLSIPCSPMISNGSATVNIGMNSSNAKCYHIHHSITLAILNLILYNGAGTAVGWDTLGSGDLIMDIVIQGSK